MTMRSIYLILVATLFVASQGVAQEVITRDDIESRALAYTRDAYAENLAEEVGVKPSVPEVAKGAIPCVDYENYIQVGTALPSLVQMYGFEFNFGVDIDNKYLNVDNFSEELAYYRYYWTKEYMVNAINVEYGHKVKDWLALGVKGYVGFSTRARRHDVTNELLYRSSMVALSAIFNVRFDWLRRQWVTMYSSVGVGVATVIERYNSNVYPMYDLVFVGLGVGKRFYGYVELGSGVSGSLRVGVGVRF